jgi:hypothetical protein
MSSGIMCWCTRTPAYRIGERPGEGLGGWGGAKRRPRSGRMLEQSAAIRQAGCETNVGEDHSPASVSISHYFTSLLRSALLPSPPTNTMFSPTYCMLSSKSLKLGHRMR